MKKIVFDFFLFAVFATVFLLLLTYGLDALNGSTPSVWFGLSCIFLAACECVTFLPTIIRNIITDWEKYQRFFVLAGMVLLLNVAIGCTRISPGHVGVVVNLYGTDRGVANTTLRTGMVWYNPFTESVFEFPTFVQTAVWTASTTEGNPVNEEISFTNGDQMLIRADISLAYHLVPEKVPAFYVMFRTDRLDTFTHGILRNWARETFDNLAGKYKIENIMGDNAQFLAEVRSSLQKTLAPIGVQLDQFGFIGAPRPPEAITKAINDKVQAVQRAIQSENELRRTEAEAKKRIAEAEGEARATLVKAEAQAKANEVVARSITPALIQYKLIEQWDGKRPMVEGSSGVILQLPKMEQAK